MKVLRFLRVSLLALLVALIPLSSHAAVFVSVGFAPPVLPVYVQPPCPEPGWMWTPGYWAYGDEGYYWVPGTWVPAPYVGALWTPGYWGWGSGLYVWHPGYWGPHVGYYGGVNYGFGYMGIGFAGGVWAGGAFRYNTAVMHVGPGIRNVYVDNTIVHNTTVINDRHVAFSGGPGGINHPPTAQENQFSHEQHVAATSYQTQHQNTAMQNKGSYFNANHGHPSNAAVARPMGVNAQSHTQVSNGGHFSNAQPQAHTFNAPSNGGQSHPQPQAHTYNTPSNGGHPQPEVHESRPAPQSHGGEPHGQPHPDNHDKGH